jgi:hypothetical protein
MYTTCTVLKVCNSSYKCNIMDSVNNSILLNFNHACVNIIEKII